VLAVADEVLVGTRAIEQPGFVADAGARHPGRILAALDVRGARATVDGWARSAPGGVEDLARRLVEEGAARLVVTDAERDGTLTGPNVALLARIRVAVPSVPLVAAGGVRSLADLRALAAVGCDGAVVGMALLDGSLDPAEAVAVLG
jgi:phosphoribosylformimino-5-aminoimidazole carboxamide ribotide isomerase